MPELAFAFLVGQLVTWILTAVFYVLLNRRHQQYKLIDQQLLKAGLRWDKSTDEISFLANKNLAKNRLGLLKSFLIFGFMISFLSWLGAIGLSLIFITYFFFIKPRLSSLLLESRLNSEENLTPEEILDFLKSNSVALN